MDAQTHRTLDDIEREAPGLLADALHIEVSGRFKAGTDRETGEYLSTTWVTRATDNGLTDCTLEAELDLPTHYPLDGDCNGLSGDYHAFVTAQMHGKAAAHDYALLTGENAGYFGAHAKQSPNPDDTARRRQVIRDRIHELCRTSSRQNRLS